MTALHHRLVADYLARLRAEAQRLPRDQGDELVADIEAHLLDALEPTPDRGAPTEARIREVLDRLGSPAELVDAADPAEQPSPSSGPGTRNQGRAEAAAPILLVLAAVIFPVWFLSVPMWLAGLVVLVLASRWSLGQKLLGALAWGTLLPLVWVMLGTVAATSYCEGEGCTVPDPGLTLVNYLAIGFTIVWLAFVVWATVRLVRAARRA